MAFSLLRYMWPEADSSLVRLLKERSQKEHEKSVEITIEKIHHLHESVIIEILSWLPVKELFKYKSVCKLWNAIISSPDLISKHLKNYYQNNLDLRDCVLGLCCVKYYGLCLFPMLVDETPRFLASERLISVDSPLSGVCGPCDGFYLLSFDFIDRHSIWNPVMNEIRHLPRIITNKHPDSLDGSSTGFGFDQASRDYKVVVIKYQFVYTSFGVEMDEDHPLSVYVYSLRNDSWRYCGDLRQFYRLDRNKCNIFVNGCCYWLESNRYEDDEDYIMGDTMITFNVATEASEEVHLPDYKRPASKCLAIYDECLALTTTKC